MRCNTTRLATAFLLVLSVSPVLSGFVAGSAARAAESESASPAAADARAASAQEGEVWTLEELRALARRIQGQVEELRGLRFERPVEVKLADRDGFLEYAKTRMARTETPESVAADEAIAKLLGLVPPDTDLLATMLGLLEEQVGGFYDPDTDTFWLMETFTGGIAKVILAHELTHALDDQHFDLDGTLERVGTTTDRELAYQAVVEGSGTAFQNQWLIAHLSEIGGMAALSESAGMLPTEALETAPPYFWKPLLAVYLQGEAFLRKDAKLANLAGKSAATSDVDAAFTAPPRSTEQILHPKKYWDAEERDEPRALAFSVGDLPAGWEVIAEDTLGELVLAMVATPMDDRGGLDASNPFAILSLKMTNDAAAGWGGDRLVLLGKGDARLLHLATVWDSAADAVEFRDAMIALSEPIAERVEGLHTALPAEAREGTASGFRVSTVAPELADLVRVTAWTGATKSEVEAVLAALVVREVL